MTAIEPSPTGHEQGGALAARGPLAGITVVDLSWHLAGPFCTLVLADLGARVIKVEAPGSHGGYDPGGFIRHYHKGQDAHYMALNRNKQSITLDLKALEGKDIFKRLCQRADVVFNNFRAGVMQRLGLGYEAIREVNPEIIFASLSSFGQDGPYVERPGVDLVVQALSGGMSMTGEPGRPPVRAGIPIGDLAGGMWAAVGILAALRARSAGLQRSGELDVSLLDGQLAMTPCPSARHFLDGTVPGPQGSAGQGAACGVFRCSDGRYVAVVVTGQEPWAGLCRVLGRPELRDDRRFSTAASRAEHGEELADVIGQAFGVLPSAEWEARLQHGAVPYARVNRLDEALADPQVLGRDMVVEIEHTLGGRLRFVGNPIRIPGYRQAHASPPLIGEHTSTVLAELGVGDGERRRLEHGGVV